MDSRFVLGGLIIPEDVWPTLAEGLQTLRDKHGIHGELKWRHFAPHREGASHALSHLDAAAKDAVRSSMYRMVCEQESVRVIAVRVDVFATYREGIATTADELYWQAFRTLIGEFQRQLDWCARALGQRIHGIVVCDHRAPRDDARLRELHSRTIARFNDNPGRRCSNLIEGLFMAPSHLSVGIQYADVVAGAVYRDFSAGDSRHLDELQQAVRRSINAEHACRALLDLPELEV